MNRDVPAESVKDVWIMAGHGGVPLDDYMQYFIEVISLSSHSVIHADSYGALGLYSIPHHHTGVSDHLRSSPLDIVNMKILCLCWSGISFQFALQLRREHLAIKNNIILKNCISILSHRKIWIISEMCLKTADLKVFISRFHHWPVYQSIKNNIVVKGLFKSKFITSQ